jgi:L-methionine (R)-S-oxide reductase
MSIEADWPGLPEIRSRLAGSRSVDDVVEALRAHARAVAGADGIAVVLREGGFCRYVAEDAVTTLWSGSRFPLGECISGWSMLTGEVAVIPDIEADPRIPREAYRSKPLRTLVMTPIGRPAPSAALGAYWCAMVDVDPGTVARLGVLADLAGKALSRIRADSLEACA